MEPSYKSPEVKKFLDDLLGGVSREDTIRSNVCIPPPIGCGKPIGKFKDAESVREYQISGLCQDCQDKIFDI